MLYVKLHCLQQTSFLDPMNNSLLNRINNNYSKTPQIFPNIPTTHIQWLVHETLKCQYRYTVYPNKYAHGFCFAVLCCGYTLTDFPISIRLTSLALLQSNDCPSASKATLMNMDKYFMWIHYERLHNHNKAKHNKTVCIFLGIYCTWCKLATSPADILTPKPVRPPAATVPQIPMSYFPWYQMKVQFATHAGHPKIVHMIHTVHDSSCAWFGMSGCSHSNGIVGIISLIARFMGPTWGPSGSIRTQVGPMFPPWTLLSGMIISYRLCLSNGYKINLNRELSWRQLQYLHCRVS